MVADLELLQEVRPMPKKLPSDTKNVPTFVLFKNPENARLQLDNFVASRGFHKNVNACALNEIDEWGPYDYSQIHIENTEPE